MPVIAQSSVRMWVEPITELETPAATVGRVVPVTRTGPNAHPWDEAHQLVRSGSELEGVGQPSYAEPELVQEFPFERVPDSDLESFTRPPCSVEPPDSFWPVGAPQFGWHLDEAHSQLKIARDRVGDPSGRRIRVGILDTGFDPAHVSLPIHLRLDLARNLVDGDSNDATDPGRHFPGNQPGHGTATMALLAGQKVAIGISGFDDFLGGAPFAEVVPVRIADSVIHFRTGSMSDGIDYAVVAGCDVVSISMGGVPTRAWAEAVNRAYDSGLVVVAAAGNRFGPSPPSSIIYPARFHRVIAACGVTADFSPYYRSGLHRHMQGCFGPSSKMATAIAAYTPNAPWAVMGCETRIGFGGGTSSATPQVAAAAALWLQRTATPAGIAPWQRIEAVRWAMFSSAAKDLPDREQYFGQGLLRASAALDVAFRDDLPMTPPDELRFPWLRLLGVLETVPEARTGEELMFEVEALQVFLQTPGLEALVDGADPLSDDISPSAQRKLVAAMRQSPIASRSLRTHLAQIDRRLSGTQGPTGNTLNPEARIGEGSVTERINRLRQILAGGPVSSGEAATESMGGFEGTEEIPPPDGAEVTRRVEHSRDDLHRIVRDYLDDQRSLHDLADEIARRGERALKLLQTGKADELERNLESLGDLEAIVRTDGSRPTFLIRDGTIDRDSSPIGSWGPSLDADAANLAKAIACVGRIDDPSIQAGYGGTGILIHKNLILTNRHVLQRIARQKDDKSWELHANTAIDFGHEFRGRESVTRRRLKGVVFVGDKKIDPWSIDHAKLDVAVIELEPANDETRPPIVMSIDAANDWAGAGGPDVYTIGYPFKPPPGIYTPTLLEQLFQQLYGYKRLAPGSTIAPRRSAEAWTVAHDGTTLGGNSGSVVVVAGRPVIAASLHYGGSPKEPAENWGHILGRTLTSVGEGGKTLGEVLDGFEVVFSNRTVTG